MSKNAVALLSLALLFPIASAQTPISPPPPPNYSAGPLTDYSAAQPDTSDALRFKRGDRYNIQDPTVPELGDTSEPIELQSETHFKRDPLPFDLSDAIVVGLVKSGQAHFSNDKRRLYSEFSVELQDVIKAPSGLSLIPTDSIDVQREGGRVRLPSGKVLVRAATAKSMPRIGRRYLLFLKYDPEVQDYALITGYQLEGDQVYRLDELRPEDDNYKRVEHPLRPQGEREDQFLARTREQFHSRKKGN